jgi:hypothetical protein
MNTEIKNKVTDYAEITTSIERFASSIASIGAAYKTATQSICRLSETGNLFSTPNIRTSYGEFVSPMMSNILSVSKFEQNVWTEPFTTNGVLEKLRFLISESLIIFRNTNKLISCPTITKNNITEYTITFGTDWKRYQDEVYRIITDLTSQTNQKYRTLLGMSNLYIGQLIFKN